MGSSWGVIEASSGTRSAFPSSETEQRSIKALICFSSSISSGLFASYDEPFSISEILAQVSRKMD